LILPVRGATAAASDVGDANFFPSEDEDLI